MQFYGSPAIAGVEQCASLYRISSGWLVSYRPKPPDVVKPRRSRGRGQEARGQKGVAQAVAEQPSLAEAGTSCPLVGTS